VPPPVNVACGGGAVVSAGGGESDGVTAADGDGEGDGGSGGEGEAAGAADVTGAVAAGSVPGAVYGVNAGELTAGRRLAGELDGAGRGIPGSSRQRRRRGPGL